MADIRDEIIKSLTELGVDSPHTATIGQLRRLLRDVVGDGASNISITTDSTEIASQADTAAAAEITEMVTTSAVVNAITTPISTAVADTITTAATAVTAATNTIATTTAANAAAVTNIIAVTTAANATAVTNASAVTTAAAVATAAAVTTATTVAAVSDTTAATASFVDTAVDTNYNNNTIDLAANPGATGINNIDNELTALRKRVEMLRLMKEINDLGGSAGSSQQQRRLDYGDIEHALPKFSGDDISMSITDFIRDFEEVTEASGADDRFRLVALRRCLTGTAKVFLSSTTALNYGALKKALEMEFSVPVTRNEVYKMLAQRRWDKKKESLHCYVLAMQAIAKRAKVEEQEVIEFVIDGIRNIVPNAHLLLPARTLAELKTLIRRYARKYLVSDVVATTGRRQATKTVEDAKQKCYNCSRDGHIKPNCPYPLRPDGSCFRCWRMGHDHRSCPNPAKILKPKTQVASVMEGGDDESYDVNTYNFSG
ncbi:PREDICTED: uncharacterized protein LOC108362612 isoform X2 [Rhagoletis zephyria]|uniref:uncharacterized protein LOC108362612 isoform X2 n=1 Tax=Rhagoletis zephyria TaxID=28612 RepID=UPI000811544E|nr:PREDICTED: uncharacterized protein LOC108362612 isoform X2 [Rhagoletis zephyria]